MRNLNIRVKLIILTLIIMIPISAVQAISIYFNYKQHTEEKLQSNVQLAQIISNSYYSYIKELWGQELIIGQEILNDNSNSEIQLRLDRAISNTETAINRLSWVSPEGIVIASTRQYMIGQSIVEREYFQRIIAGEEKVISNVNESYLDKSTIVSISRGIKRNGKLVGILVASIDPIRLVSYMPNIELKPGDILRLIDSEGGVIYESHRTFVSFEERNETKEAFEKEAFKGEIVKIDKYKSGFDGSYRMGVAYPIEELGVLCSITSLRSLVLKETYRLAVRSAFILALVSIISMTLAYIMSSKMVKPLLILKNKADELKEGNYSVRTNISGCDEIASTAEAFDLMADSIEKYDKMKNQFFTNLSHEFKTPINVIYSSVQLIESFDDKLELKEFKNKTLKNVAGIKQNCYRLIKLVDNMIDVNRYNTGELHMKLYNIDIVSIIENVSLSVVKFAEQKGITIIFDTDIEEKEICCDPYMIERIMLNLISNSIKFTNEGGLIYINVYNHEDKVVFSVKDTGIGMSEDNLSLIFDRFKQIDGSLNRDHEGSGLGLSIVKALVEAHKGNISVYSKLGEGTEFRIELPIDVYCECKKEDEESLEESSSNTIQKIRVEFSDIYSIEDILKFNKD